MSKVPSDYAAVLADIKSRVQSAQSRAVLAVNAELVRLYWDVGGVLEARQRQAGWGAAVIPTLARDLHNELPELKGFSERNIGRMLAFHRAYRDVIWPPAVAKGQQRNAPPPNHWPRHPPPSHPSCCWPSLGHTIKCFWKR